MARSKPAAAASDTTPRLRRAYFETRYGQLHVHYAIPAGGGFEEGATLLCFHHLSAKSATIRDAPPLA